VRNREREPEGGPDRGPPFLYNWIAERARKKVDSCSAAWLKMARTKVRRKASFTFLLLPSPLPLGRPAT